MINFLKKNGNLSLITIGTWTFLPTYENMRASFLKEVNFSSIIDNGSLVAATQGMFSLADYPMDNSLWEFIALCAGTGGSMLIIGSAAGVAAMGMEKIDFIWYLKKITWLAFAGFMAGALTFLFIEHFIR